MTVSKNVCFTMTSHCSTRKVHHYWNFLNEVLMMYYCRGLRVEIVRGDLEFKPLEQLVKELPRVPKLDLAAKEKLAGDVKRNICYLNENFRQLRHTLPFVQIPGVIIVWMVQVCTMTLNIFPRKWGIKYYSPSMKCPWISYRSDLVRTPKFGSHQHRQIAFKCGDAELLR